MTRLLLDTHAFLWWLDGGGELGPDARGLIAAPETIVFVSAATAWEIAVKRAKGTLDAPGDVREWIRGSDFAELPVSPAHAIESAELPPVHTDPFGRLLVAQARVEGLILLTRDRAIARYDVEVLDAGR